MIVDPQIMPNIYLLLPGEMPPHRDFWQLHWSP
jgi:hypothetical protein